MKISRLQTFAVVQTTGMPTRQDQCPQNKKAPEKIRGLVWENQILATTANHEKCGQPGQPANRQRRRLWDGGNLEIVKKQVAIVPH